MWMHREFKELLHSAEGESRRVIVVFLDVRGFSSFAGIAESTDTAEFLKSAYLKILDEYFPEAAFFKPTGDGLLILFDYDRSDLKVRLTEAVATSLRLVEEFPEICAEDPMINFAVPTKIGVGLARGSATRLTAEEKVLDYSGRPLNLAARLMDLARPAGIVLDGSFGFEQLPEEVQNRFVKDFAHVKGLAEEEPLDLFVLKDYTKISEQSRSPINSFRRHHEPTEDITFKLLEERAPLYLHPIKQEPARKETIKVHLSHPTVQPNGRRHPELRTNPTLRGTYEHAAGRHYARVDYSQIVKRMRDRGVKKSWNVRVTVEYDVIENGV
jgi:class 3 adenylate cyclase